MVSTGRALRLPAPADWDAPDDGLVVVCAANYYEGVRMGDRHVAEHLCKLTPVLYVDPPLSPLTRLRGLSPGATAEMTTPLVPRLRVAAPGLARLTPVVTPFPSRRGLTGVTSALTRLYLRGAARRLGAPVRAVVSGWPQYPIFGSCREQVRVYWSKDDYVTGAELLGLSARMLASRESQIATTADLIVATSPVLADMWRDRGFDTVLIPAGSDTAAYADVGRAPLPYGVDLPPPVAGFIGHINDRTDLELLEAVAGRGRSLVLVGPKDPAFEPRRFEDLVRRANVHWAGPQPFEALPGYLRMMDVGLVPYANSRFNQASFPLKTLEYLAAGRAVVATDLPGIRWLRTDLVTIADGPRRFAAAVDRLLGETAAPTLRARRQAFAAGHSWASRAADLLAAIDACQEKKKNK